MLYWAVFTIGFMAGGMLAAYIFTSKETMQDTKTDPDFYGFEGDLASNDPDKIFEQLTQINYSGSETLEVKGTEENILASKTPLVNASN